MTRSNPTFQLRLMGIGFLAIFGAVSVLLPHPAQACDLANREAKTSLHEARESHDSINSNNKPQALKLRSPRWRASLQGNGFSNITRGPASVRSQSGAPDSQVGPIRVMHTGMTPPPSFSGYLSLAE